MAKHTTLTVFDKAQAALGGFLDYLAQLKWSDLKPTYRSEVYPWAITLVRAELTLRHVGFGLGIGIRSFDFWIGWPPKSSR